MATDNITLPAPRFRGATITTDASGFFVSASNDSAASDASRMMRNGRLSILAMSEFMTELKQAESDALAAHNKAELRYGVNGNHPAKEATEKAMNAALDTVDALLDWIAAMRPTKPADIGLQIRLIMREFCPMACIRPNCHKALQAASMALCGDPEPDKERLSHAA